MARLETNPYACWQMSDLKNPYLIVVDMINGFTEEGALADPAIAAAAGPIEKLVQAVGEDHTLFVTDCHAPDCMEFASFPAHCVEGTRESQVMDVLKPYVKNLLKKNSINTFTAPGFNSWLAALPEDADIIVTGCCTDLCVLQLALSLQSWIHQNNRYDMRLFLPVDAVDTYDIPGVHDAAQTNAFALANMKANGIHVVSQLANDNTGTSTGAHGA